MTENQTSATDTEALKQLVLQKIYLKDCSFESPNSPEMFASGQWDPKVQLNITTSTKSVGTELWEVVLHVSIEAKQGDRAAFLCEIQQAGVVAMRGFSEEERRRLLGGYCPGLIFPYAREAVSDLVGKGGFPQLLLQPLNFEALFQKHMDDSRIAQAEGAPQETH
jgi:preprotein translocase subunit SecB